LHSFRVIKKESIDLIHAHGYGSSNFAALSDLVARIPVIIPVHDESLNYPIYQKVADYLLARYIDRAIAVSEASRMSCVNKRKIDFDRIFVVYNGIAVSDFEYPSMERIQKGRDRLGIKIGNSVFSLPGKEGAAVRAAATVRLRIKSGATPGPHSKGHKRQLKI
jgi:glycosyltransferase involved in cell wall biosynthesis